MDKNNKRGFSGLSDLVSDVRHDVEFLTQTQKVEVASPESEERSIGLTQQVKTASAGKNNNDPSDKWVLVGLGITICLVIWFAATSKGRDNGSYSPPPAPVPQSHTLQEPPTPVTKPTTPTPPVIPPQESQRAELQYTKPPVGTDNVLSTAELRWCIARDIAIETLRDLISTNKGVVEFNKIAEDYNSRCGSFRYYRDALERAERDVEPYRSELAAKATQDARRAGFYEAP